MRGVRLSRYHPAVPVPVPPPWNLEVNQVCLLARSFFESGTQTPAVTLNGKDWQWNVGNYGGRRGPSADSKITPAPEAKQARDPPSPTPSRDVSSPDGYSVPQRALQRIARGAASADPPRGSATVRVNP
jgi:hypothetical protein